MNHENMEGMGERAEVLVLPESPELRKRLEAKLIEYKQRREDLNKEDKSYWSPEKIRRYYKDVDYKIALLDAVLQEGRVDINGQANQLIAAEGDDFSMRAFENAKGVIEDYLKSGGSNLHGGTGLPSVTGSER